MNQVVTQNASLCWQIARSALKSLGQRGRGLFLLGFRPDALFVTESELSAHVYVTGPPNAGKTSRVLAPIFAQLVAAGHALLCVDCKPDFLLLAHLRAACLAAKRKLHVFSLQPGINSQFGIDFFQALDERTPRQVAEILVGSLGLHKSSEPYFVTQNTGALTLAITQARLKGRLSFRSIAHELRGVLGAKNKRFEHAVHALDAVEQLADVPELNPSKDGVLKVLDVVQLVREGAVCYFCLPTATESKLTSAAVASLLLKLTSAVAKDLAIRGTPPPRIFFGIDEFQEVAQSADLKELAAQVRGVGGGMSLILAHQVVEQLEDEGLRSLLRNAGLFISLAPRQFSRELQEWSGERVVWTRSVSVSHTSGANPSTNSGTSWQEQVRPGLDNETIQNLNAMPGAGVVVIQGAAPTPVLFPHHVPLALAQERERSALHGLQSSRPTRPPKPKLRRKPASVLPDRLPAAQKLPARNPLSRRIESLFKELSPHILFAPGGSR